MDGEEQYYTVQFRLSKGREAADVRGIDTSIAAGKRIQRIMGGDPGQAASLSSPVRDASQPVGGRLRFSYVLPCTVRTPGDQNGFRNI